MPFSRAQQLLPGWESNLQPLSYRPSSLPIAVHCIGCAESVAPSRPDLWRDLHTLLQHTHSRLERKCPHVVARRMSGKRLCHAAPCSGGRDIVRISFMPFPFGTLNRETHRLNTLTQHSLSRARIDYAVHTYSSSGCMFTHTASLYTPLFAAT